MGNTRKSYWQTANSLILITTLNNVRFKKQGYLIMFHLILIHQKNYLKILFNMAETSALVISLYPRKY